MQMSIIDCHRLGGWDTNVIVWEDGIPLFKVLDFAMTSSDYGVEL